MRVVVLLVVCVLVAGTQTFPFAQRPVSALQESAGALVTKHCKSVVKKVHGKKRRVRVCAAPKKTPTPTPVPTSPPSRFGSIAYLSLDQQGNVYTADCQTGHSLRLSGNGDVLATWSVGANAVAVDASGDLYASLCPPSLGPDGNNVVEFSPTGQRIRAWGKDSSFGIAVGRDGAVYVSNFDQSRIDKYAPDGTLIGHFGSPGTGPGQLDHPTGLALDDSGNVYVADHRNNRIVKFSPSGQALAVFGPSLPAPYHAFDRPENVSVDAGGNIYVSDGDYLQELSPSGVPVAQWAPTAGSLVFGVAVDGRHNVYVSEMEGSYPNITGAIVKLSADLHVIATWQ